MQNLPLYRIEMNILGPAGEVVNQDIMDLPKAAIEVKGGKCQLRSSIIRRAIDKQITGIIGFLVSRQWRDMETPVKPATQEGFARFYNEQAR